MRLWLNSTRGFRRFTRGSGVPRLRRSAFCELRCCSFSIRSARSGSWSNGWSSTCCFAGSSGLDRREGVRRLDLLEEPRPPAHARDRAGVSVFAPWPAGGEGASDAEHFSVDGTLLKAWASMKSFRPKSASGEGAGNGPGEPPGHNGEVDFRKTKRSNATHASTTDKDARLFRKGAGQESRLRLSWPRLDGEPQRAGGGGRGDAGDRNGRARGGGCFSASACPRGRPSAPTRATTPRPSSRA